MQLKRGDYFIHRHFLDPRYMSEKKSERRPIRGKVTAVRNGAVYYRAFYGFHDDGTEWLGSPYTFLVEKTEGSVLKVIPKPKIEDE